MADVPIATRAAHIYIHILDPLENYDDSDIITVDVRKRGGALWAGRVEADTRGPTDTIHHPQCSRPSVPVIGL